MPLYFGVFVSIAAYMVGMWLKKKLKWGILNPLLVAVVLVIALSLPPARPFLLSVFSRFRASALSVSLLL